MYITFKHRTAVIGAALLAIMFVSSSAFADSGDLVRKGRFVWRAVSGDLDPTHGSTSTAAKDTRVIYDKGDLGKYVRHGRFVTKIYNDESAKPSASPRATTASRTRVVDHYKHKHVFPN
ncbi:MAG: hypothetical protein HUU46_23710 [Candidatus Hydrogenedentes bacterium]|nr:hypothetical protein [Candidatus Hydrogenedentota bacterium]